MANRPDKYPERYCEVHGILMVVRPNGFAYGKQQYRQLCLECKAVKFKASVTALGGYGVRIRQARSKFPDRNLARRKTEAAIRGGKLIKQPCERCGVSDNIHAHHEDYSLPLQVMWLCTKHHAERHMELLRGKAA